MEEKKEMSEESYMNLDQLLEMNSIKLESIIFKMKHSDVEPCTRASSGFGMQ